MAMMTAGTLPSDSEEEELSDSPPVSQPIQTSRMESPARDKLLEKSSPRLQTGSPLVIRRDASGVAYQQQKRASIPPAAVVTPHIKEALIAEEKDMRQELASARKNMRHLISILENQRNQIPRNILLVGQPGHGKSALINLLHSALREQYEAITEPGDGYTESHTNHLLFFENFGLNEEHRQEFLHKCHLPKDYHLPTLIDMPGFVNSVSIIEDILKGLVLPNADLRKLMRGEAMDVPVDGATASERAVDRVVFVASIKKDITGVMKEVFKAVNGYDGDGGSCIPHNLVITHIDKASDPRSIEEKTLVDELVKSLQLSATRSFKVHEVSNYNESDPIDSERRTAYATDLKKQADGLEILCQILSPQKKIEPPERPPELKRVLPRASVRSEEKVGSIVAPEPVLEEDKRIRKKKAPCCRRLLCIAIMMIPVSVIFFVLTSVGFDELHLLTKDPSHFLSISHNLMQHYWEQLKNKTSNG